MEKGSWMICVFFVHCVEVRQRLSIHNSHLALPMQHLYQMTAEKFALRFSSCSEFEAAVLKGSGQLHNGGPFLLYAWGLSRWISFQQLMVEEAVKKIGIYSFFFFLLHPNSKRLERLTNAYQMSLHCYPRKATENKPVAKWDKMGTCISLQLLLSIRGYCFGGIRGVT